MLVLYDVIEYCTPDWFLYAIGGTFSLVDVFITIGMGRILSISVREPCICICFIYEKAHRPPVNACTQLKGFITLSKWAFMNKNICIYIFLMELHS